MFRFCRIFTVIHLQFLLNPLKHSSGYSVCKTSNII
uniref:Uncharacterized protein n=1 Tax=Anguilla anguilla TaxID=7936 RepID=A0A0E9S174_ANGAN